MRALMVAALLLAPLVPTVSAVAPPADPFAFVMRADEDGGVSLLLAVEDGRGGVITTTGVTPANTRPHLRAVGAYTRAYAGFEGAPSVSAGVLVANDSTILRVPLVIVEGVASTAQAQAQLLDLVNLALAKGGNGLPFVEEMLLPELAPLLGRNPDGARFTTYRDWPTLYVWTLHRSSPAGDVWAGHYLARTGEVAHDGSGAVEAARADAEIGVATRIDGQTRRVAGAFVESEYRSAPHAQRDLVTVGTVADAQRIALAALDLHDEREGGDLVQAPDSQRTGASVGAYADGAFVPLVGVETEQTMRPSQEGTAVERVTSIGPYVDGEFVPVAGASYRSNAGTSLATALALVNGGPGHPSLGDFALDVGIFPEGEYVPMAGIVHRSHFREQRYAYASLVGAGVYTPLGFAPVAVTSYDGSLPLLDWADALLAGTADGSEWMVATGTMAAGAYVPAVGVQSVGRAPLQSREAGHELRLGVFAGSYHAFVPLLSLAYEGDRAPVQQALAFFNGGTLGGSSGSFEARAGSYAAGSYVPAAGARVEDGFDGAWTNETMVVLGAYAGEEFVPLVGVLYAGEDDVLGSFNSLTASNDDDTARLYAGVFVQGAWVPLVMVENSGDAVRVVPAP